MSESLASSLEALRRQGGGHFDAVRCHYLEVLSRRVDGASGELRRILAIKLEKALADHAERIAQMPKVAGTERHELSASAPLSQLNHYIQGLTSNHAGKPGWAGGEESSSDIKSVRRFRETWSRIAAEKQVSEAFGRGPENAGPLNAHMLVLHSLRLMRDLSPHYLQQFMSQVDSLLWLDQVNQKYTLADAKPARPGRARK